MLLLVMLLTMAQTAWAADVTTHITYDGVAASDVTVNVTYTYNDGLFFSTNETKHETLSNGSRFYPVNNTVVTIAVTSTQSISTEFSATYVVFGQNQPLTVSTNGNNCTFTPDPDYETTLNITVRPGGVQAYYVHYSTGDEFGVSGSMADQTFYVGVAQNLSPCGFTRDGYTFAGWATTPNGSVVYSDGQEVTDIAEAGQTITLYAKWTKNSSGGDDPFNPGGDDPSNPGGDDPLPANTYRVRFDGNQANCVGLVSGSMDDQMFTVGVAQALAANEFTNNLQGLFPYCGWNTKADGSGTAYADGQVVTDIAAEGQTITLYAQWGDNSSDPHDLNKSYAVHFNANGGTGWMASQWFAPDELKNLSPCTFTRTHYNFTGWNTQADGSGTAYTDQQNINPGGNITLYAQWEKEADLAVNGNTYTINTAAGWGQFCDLLEGNDKGFFSGKTVKLAYDISVSRMAGASYHDFIGTFDGNQKTLTFNYTTSAENAAPFQYVENATIKNLHVAGTIQTSNKYAAGIIAQQYGTVSIQNCRSSVVINSSINGDGTHGGLVAVNNNSASLTIDGCVFDGKLLSTGTTATTATTNCGGFVGYSNSNKGATATVTNSLYTPAALESGETECTSGSYTFVRNGSAGDNCYYTRTLGTAQGTWEGEPDFVKRGDGAGTSANPYKITNANDLKDLACYVNGTGTYSNGFSETTAHNCSDVYFQQTNPITLTSAWTPIGTTSANPFKGHYDGGNFTISGLTVSGNYQYAGLFGFISSDYYHGSQIPTELKNINIVDCNIDVSSAGQGNGKAGGIAGYVSCFNMSNCKVSGTIKGYGYAAGLIGQAGSFCTMTGCFADVTVSAHKADPNAQYPPAYYLIGQYSNNMSASGNYYHDNGGNVSANNNSVIKNSATPLYMVTGAPSGVTVAATNATLTYNNTPYFASGATVTLTVNDADKSIIAFTATGAASSEVATNKKSATITLASSDVTVSATLQTVSGTTDDGLTWSLTQDNSGNYTVLTISGTGAMKTYGYTTVGGLWRTTAPWGWQLTSVTIGNGVTSIGNFAFIGCQSLATVTIGNSVATIGENAFDHCDAMTSLTLPASVTTLGANAFKNCVNLERIDIGHDGAVSLAANVFQNDNELQYIVFPSPTAVQTNAEGNWSGFTTKLRAKFGNQLFGVTTEGGTAAYKIATADDLRNLAAAVNVGNSGSGKTFRQTADIDLSSGGNFTPIGTGGSTIFSGTYDGGGKNISGLTVNGSYRTAGLFGCVSSGTVRNVILVSPTVSSTLTDVTSVFVGTIAGDCSFATIENCHVINPTVSAPGNVYSTKSIGALIGYLDELLSITSITNNYVTNCYYYGGNQSNAIGHTDANSTVTRVSAAHLVNLGNNVTIQTAMADELGFTCDSDGDDVVENYWRQGAELTLGNTLGEAPEYYALNYATTAGTINGSTLTVGNADATVSAAIRSDGQPHSITYMKADGTTDQADAIALDGTETSLGDYWQEKWYFVGIDFSHTGEIRCYGDVHIILCDGKTMTVDGNGSHALWSPFGNFYFYGQNGQTGTLNATGRINAADNNAGTLTINGGIINATGDYGISAYGLIINRGTVNATGNDGHGIWSGGDLIINGGTVNAPAAAAASASTPTTTSPSAGPSPPTASPPAATPPTAP